MSINAINPIAISANGISVYNHPESHSHRPDLNAEVINKITLPDDSTFFREVVDLGRVIGKDHLVETQEKDTIVYLQRGNRPGKSRMVLKEAEDTSFVTIIACVACEEEGTPTELVGKWILVTLFEGKPGEREPFDRSFADGKNPEGKAAAEAFWATHALVPTEQEKIQILEENEVDVDDLKNCEEGNWHINCEETIYEQPERNDVFQIYVDSKEEALNKALEITLTSKYSRVESVYA